MARCVRAIIMLSSWSPSTGTRLAFAAVQEPSALFVTVRLRTIPRRVEGPNGHPDGRGGYCFARFVAFPRGA